VVLRPLALNQGERLVLLQPRPRTAGPFALMAVTEGDFLDWQGRNHVFDSMTAFTGATFSLTSGGEPERVSGASVTWGFFETVGASALAGRPFRAADRNLNQDVVVIGRN